MKRSFLSFAVLAAVLVTGFALTATAQSLPDYELVELPHPTTELGEFPSYWRVQLSNRDEVAGTARRFCRSVGFRFSTRHGMEVFNLGDHNTFIDAVSDAGYLFGRVFEFCGENQTNEEIFRYHKSSGFDFLSDGLTEDLKKRFTFRDLNKQGEIAGFHRTESGALSAWVYRNDQGWVDMETVDARLDMGVAAQINDDGDVLVYSLFGGGFQDTFVVSDGGIVEAGDLGTAFTSLIFQDDGTLTGSSRLPGATQPHGADHAVLFRPENGELVDIHPKGAAFVHSFAYKKSRRGVVAGIVDRSEHRENKLDVFVYEEGKGSRIRLRERRIASLLSPGLEFDSWYVASFNRGLEMAATIHARDPGLPPYEDDVFVPFYHSPKHGLFTLQELVDEIAPGLGTVNDVMSINDRGTMLVEIRKPTDRVLALLVRKK